MKGFMHPLYRKLNCLEYISDPFDADQRRNRITNATVDLCAKPMQAKDVGQASNDHESTLQNINVPRLPAVEKIRKVE